LPSAIHQWISVSFPYQITGMANLINGRLRKKSAHKVAALVQRIAINIYFHLTRQHTLCW